mmetsp:Transcript_28257/g.34298  ORF Transcript_28257/g.34298 Transcript_28257/m.34298 type:complete len:710 (-) Transcript_28257:750-2879(-)|eukprot:CAMPEP_0197847264 /NCGR_PEP_ID=MMETSP1438-20131217/5675_1 /TAXON_ID=1461541 /ORGANISM="Pterosperma sp., Strain CCMP1384" /LENGTH=709 /DNA_ID=CAMNT_0043459135 /DNA_START=223 /DNA_END=2352 /DNA_ORIENTATION=+
MRTSLQSHSFDKKRMPRISTGSSPDVSSNRGIIRAALDRQSGPDDEMPTGNTGLAHTHAYRRWLRAKSGVKTLRRNAQSFEDLQSFSADRQPVKRVKSRTSDTSFTWSSSDSESESEDLDMDSSQPSTEELKQRSNILRSPKESLPDPAQSPGFKEGLSRRQMMAGLAACGVSSSMVAFLDQSLESLGGSLQRLGSLKSPKETDSPHFQSETQTSSPHGETTSTVTSAGSGVTSGSEVTTSAESVSVHSDGSSAERGSATETVSGRQGISAASTAVGGIISSSHHHHPNTHTQSETTSVPCDWLDGSTNCCSVDSDGNCIVSTDDVSTCVVDDSNCLEVDAEGNCVVSDDGAAASVSQSLKNSNRSSGLHVDVECREGDVVGHTQHYKPLQGQMKEVEQLTESTLEERIAFTSRSPTDSYSAATKAAIRTTPMDSPLARKGLTLQTEIFQEGEDFHQEDEDQEVPMNQVDDQDGGLLSLGQGEIMVQSMAVTVLRMSLLNGLEGNADMQWLYDLGVHPFFVTLALGILCTVAAQGLTDIVYMWNKYDSLASPKVGASPSGVAAIQLKAEGITRKMLKVPSLSAILRYTCLTRLYIISLAQIGIFHGLDGLFHGHLNTLVGIQSENWVLSELNTMFKVMADLSLACTVSMFLSTPLQDVQRKVFYKIFRSTKDRNQTLYRFFCLDLTVAYLLYMSEGHSIGLLQHLTHHL